MNLHRTSLGLPVSGGAPYHRRRRSLGANETVMEFVKTSAPVVKELLESDDPTEDVETLRVRIRNHERIRDGYFRGTIFWTVYDNKVQVLKAKLRAAKERQVEQKKTTVSRWEWAGLGKAATVTGILVGASFIALLLNASGAAKRAYRHPAPRVGVHRKRIYRGTP